MVHRTRGRHGRLGAPGRQRAVGPGHLRQAHRSQRRRACTTELDARPAPLPRRVGDDLRRCPRVRHRRRQLRRLRSRRRARPVRQLLATVRRRLGHRRHVPVARRRADLTGATQAPHEGVARNARTGLPAVRLLDRPRRASGQRLVEPSVPGDHVHRHRGDRRAHRAADAAAAQLAGSGSGSTGSVR